MRFSGQTTVRLALVNTADNPQCETTDIFPHGFPVEKKKVLDSTK